jgi:hypothetical protein
MRALTYCSCGYQGYHWEKHRETSLRWGHARKNHMLLGWIYVDPA